MESKLKQQCQDYVGEIPTYENLLLREGGFPHLPDTSTEPELTDWNAAGTKPDHPCLCETEVGKLKGNYFQYWNGEFWGFTCGAKDQAIAMKDYHETSFAVIKWREVQP